MDNVYHPWPEDKLSREARKECWCSSMPGETDQPCPRHNPHLIRKDPRDEEE